MATAFISSYAGDAGATRSPSFPIPRTRYVSLQKSPESDGGEGQYYFSHPPRVVDSASCGRQLYLRNGYTFSRKQSVSERTIKCLGKVKDRVAVAAAVRKFQYSGGGGYRSQRRTRLVVVKRVKEFSCDALRSIFQRLLSCTTSVSSVDVVEHK